MRRDAALVALQADADAARLDQVRNRTAQAEGVAGDAGRGAAERHPLVGRRRIGGDVVEARQALLVDRGLERRPIEIAGDVGQRLGDRGVGRLEDHHVGCLQAVELLDPAPGDAELVMVEHHVGRQGFHRRMHGAHLGLAQQQVIAVAVGARGQHALVVGRAVDIGARHDHDGDLRQAAARARPWPASRRAPASPRRRPARCRAAGRSARSPAGRARGSPPDRRGPRP